MTAADEGATRFIGRPVRRREDPRMLSGNGRYIADMSPPGCLQVAFVRSTAARGRIVSIETGDATAMPGVHAVLTAKDLNHKVVEWWSGLAGRPSASSPYPPHRALADVDVRFVGDPIAMVVADDRYLAEDAAERVEVDIEVLAPVIGIDGALCESSPLVHPELPTNVARSVSPPVDAALEEVFRSAAHVFERTFCEARASHVPMEPRGIVASWDGWSSDMRIWSSSQNPHEVRAFCSRLLNLPEHHIRAVIGDVGGGFGQKVCVSKEEACVMLAAHALGRPIKWIEDRWENLVAAGQGRDDRITVALATDDDGRFLGLRATLYEDVGAYPASGTGSSAGLVGAMLSGPYRIPKVAFGSSAVYTNTAGRVSYRGPWLMETVGREQIVDVAAAELGVEPLELRLRNLVNESDMPFTSPSGQTYEGVALDRTVALAVDRSGYPAMRQAQADMRAQGRLVGIGCSLYVEPSGVAPRGPLATEGVSVRIEPTGTVTVFAATANAGNSVETTLPQIVADRLGCDIDDVVLIQGDTSVTPFGSGMGGSRNAPVFGGATWEASGRLRAKVVALAAHQMEASEHDLEVERGRVSVRGTPGHFRTFADLAQAAYMDPKSLPAGMDPGLEVLVRYAPPSPFTWSNACHLCQCEIDITTGEIALIRYVVAEDCGVVINPMVVEGQVAGGVVQGIGGVLFEHMVYDPEGNPLTTTFMDYLLPTATEVPPIECCHVETPAEGSGGFRGMGEGGAIGSPAAVANAINDALAPLGIRLTRFPMRPSDIIEEMLDRADLR